MSQSVVSGPGGDPLLAELVEEITDKLQKGEPVDLEVHIQQYPERAEELRKLLPALHMLAVAGSAAVSDDRPEPPVHEEAPLSGILGDFRIIHEIGRGGMGVVYEAEQVSLRRRVALKVLPFAAMMDPRKLQRFHHEAQAAACLHHNHIVPVYFVGCERGVHFYAMQLIEGQTLAGLIHELRERASAAEKVESAFPAVTTLPQAALSTETLQQRAAYYRQVAQWGAQAADALDYAHQMGVVHRDIKPANLMVDNRGEVWVTDFGLAQFQQAEGSLTLTGDLMGTLRYMSPEQALGKRVPTDHRTDLYSLGVTLYELLTLKPAFAGQDRQELLRQIAFEEPQRLRRINKSIPVELEIIVLKATEKNSSDRYATAQELAEDLKRWLEDTPVRAKRPSPVQRASKWARRHRSVVTTTAASLLVILVGLSAALVKISVTLEERTRALQERDAALAEARAQNARVESQRRQAEANFRDSLWVIDDLLMPFRSADSRSEPLTVAEVKRWQTGTALRFLDAFSEAQSEQPTVRLGRGRTWVAPTPLSAQDVQNDPELQLLKGIALGHQAAVYALLGEREQWLRTTELAAKVFRRLAQKYPQRTVYRRDLSLTLQSLAGHFYQAGRPEKGRDLFRESVAVLRDAIALDPNDAESCYLLAVALASGPEPTWRDPKAAVEHARRAVELAPQQPRSWLELGIAHYHAGNWRSAESALREFLDRYEGPWTRTRGRLFLAMAQWRNGKKAEALKTYQEAARTMDERFDARPGNGELRAEAQELLGIKE